MLYVVTAVIPLFNTVFVDRVLAVAHLEEIQATLILNKTDLGTEDTAPLIDIYERLEIPIFYTSAKHDHGLDEIRSQLETPALSIVALAGVSGVGKSTILNKLVPEAERKTAEVSRKTGKGRQTTSQSVGYLYNRNETPDLLIIDLPGVQNFGVTNLSPRQAAEGFPEFAEKMAQCEYHDCTHTAEPNCAVKDAVDARELSASRYYSYLHMLDEIDEAKEY